MSAVISKVSPAGVQFVAAHEGLVLRAYRCPAGVVTIGYGFTMRSAVFASWFRAKFGRDLRMGDTITKADADMLLGKLLDSEYGAAVVRDIAAKRQHHHDGASSVSFNCGPGSLKWQWGVALKGGDARTSAARLRVTAVNANGRRLPGLVRRRAEEAALIESGVYAGHRPNAAQSTDREDVRQYQGWLRDLGYKIAVDGIRGPQTDSAVRAFQKASDLTVDGIVGPATRAAFIRALDAKRGTQTTAAATAGSATVGSGGDVAADALMSAFGWGVTALVVVTAIVLFVRFRGVLTGTRVPT